MEDFKATMAAAASELYEEELACYEQVNRDLKAYVAASLDRDKMALEGPYHRLVFENALSYASVTSLLTILDAFHRDGVIGISACSACIDGEIFPSFDPR